MQTEALIGGFTDPPRDSAVAFRGLMQAMARPGRIETVGGASGPAPLSIAAATALMTLCDSDTSIHLAGAADTDAVRDWVAFHLGSPLTSAEKAMFVVGAWDALQPLNRFAIGTPEYPDRSATLIVEVPNLSKDGGSRLTGPGIQTEERLGLPDPEALAANAMLFPLGFDTLLTCGSQIAALPRSTRIHKETL